MSKALILLLLLTACILVAGCDEIAGSPSAPVTTPLPQPSPVLTATPSPATVPVSTMTPIILQTATPTPVSTAIPTLDSADAMTQISHRYTNTSGAFRAGNWQGAEIRFYGDGSVVYTTGVMGEVSSNIVMKEVYTTWSGTYTPLPENKYIVKLFNISSPTSQSAPNVFEATWHPRTGDSRYPGLIYPERVVLRGTASDTLFNRAKND
jgi:hypothetical protein